MITSMILSGGAYNQSYDLMSPTSPVQLERGLREQVSQRSAAVIERDPYTETLTTLPIQIIGTSEADVWNEYNTFTTFIQQIAQFRLRPDRNGITYSVKATGASSERSTLCTGSADYNPATPIISDPPAAALDDVSGMWRIRGLKVSFRRKGRLIDESTVNATAVVGTTNTPTNTREALILFPAAESTDSPMDLNISYTAAAPGILETGHLLVSNPYSYNAIYNLANESYMLINGRHLGTGGGFTAMADSVASTNPMTTGSTDLLRWIATDNDPEEKTGNPGLTEIFTDFLCLALVRSLAFASTGTMQFFLENPLGGRIYSKVMPVSGEAQVVNLGAMSVPDSWAISGFLVGVIYRNTSDSLSTIWLDTFILVNLNVANLTYFDHGPIYQSIDGYEILIRQRYLSATSPIMESFDIPGVYFYPAQQRGAMHINRKGRAVRAMWLTPGGNKWRQHADAVAITMAGFTYPASLTPSGV